MNRSGNLRAAAAALVSLTCLVSTGCGGTTGYFSPGCIRFEACVDGSDSIAIQGGSLFIMHQSYDPLGEHLSCVGVVSTVDPGTSLFDPMNGRFAVNGVGYPLSAAPLDVPLQRLASFDEIEGRGTVSMPGTDQVLLDDDPFGAAARYVVDLCE
jgi:hypothetical protein